MLTTQQKTVQAHLQKLIIDSPRSWIYKVKQIPEIYRILEETAAEFQTTPQGAAYIIVNEYNPRCSNNNLKKFTWFSNGFSYCGTRKECKCNNKKSLAKAKQTSMAKYGTEHPMQNATVKEQAKQKIMALHGVEHTSQIPATRRKAKQTSMAKYGTEHPMQNATVKERCKQQNISNHNGVISARDPTVKAKTKSTMMKRYGVTSYTYVNMSPGTLDILLSRDRFCKFVTDKSVQYVATKLKVNANTIQKYLTKYTAHSLLSKTRSTNEHVIEEFLTDNSIAHEVGNRQVIAPYELDFYLPKYNAAIEINGLYWHSENGGSKDKNYHFKKWQMCRDKGIDLYQYFDDDMAASLNVIKAKIMYITKQRQPVIGARKLVIKEMHPREGKQLLDSTHIQKGTHSKNGALGAYYLDALVAVVTWKISKQYLEITRFASNLKASYPGLFSRMLKAVMLTTQYSGPVVSFSNNSHSNGNVYRASGFKQDKILGPAYWYTKDYIVRENRQKYMKSKIAKKFNIDLSNKTEWQAMQSLGYDRVWDSGKIKWIKY